MLYAGAKTLWIRLKRVLCCNETSLCAGPRSDRIRCHCSSSRRWPALQGRLVDILGRQSAATGLQPAFGQATKLRSV